MKTYKIKRKTTKGIFILFFDKISLNLYNKYNWTIHVTRLNNVYLVRNINFKNKKYKRIIFHRKLFKLKNSSIQIDHINGNGLDNRLVNLRKCKNNQNRFNMKKRINAKTSKYKGVCKPKFKHKLKKPWLLQFYYKNKAIKKYFKTEIEAAINYDKLAKQYFGQFARLNFKGGI